MLASQPSTSANCLLVLLLQWGFDHEQVEEVGLLAVELVVELAGVFSQLGLLTTETILGPVISQTLKHVQNMFNFNITLNSCSYLVLFVSKTPLAV